MIRRTLAGVLLGGTVAAAVAQPPAPPVPDPTRPSGKLKDVLNPPPKVAPGAGPAAAGVVRLPAMALKARVVSGGKGAAVIEVGGRTQTVAAGETVVADGLPLKVLAVTPTEVRIEVVPLKEVVVLN